MPSCKPQIQIQTLFCTSAFALQWRIIEYSACCAMSKAKERKRMMTVLT